MCCPSARTGIDTDRQSGPWKCLLCGAVAAHWSDQSVDFETADGTYTVHGLRHEHCDSCGEDTFSADQLDEIQRAVADAGRIDRGRLSPAEIKQMRLDLGLTQADLEAQLAVSAGSVGRWERGTVLQGATADRLMRVIRSHPELLPELGYVAREGRGPYRARG